MSPIFLAAILLLLAAQLVLPRRFGFVPLLIAACHLANVEVVPQLTPVRLIILLGLLRAVVGGHFAFSLQSRYDRMALLFSAVALVSTFGHEADQYVPSPFAERVGLVLNVVGTYLYGRAYISGMADVERYAVALAIVVVPLGAAMTVERVTTRNVYSVVGGAYEYSGGRDGKIRAQGPFRHSILGGTAGATALALAFLAYRRGYRQIGLAGVVACFLIVFASSSSGPLAIFAISAIGLGLFGRWYNLKLYLLWSAGLALAYSAVSGNAPWFLMAKIDLVGGSTGWHRAYLIDQGLKHLSEWWLWGTDFTRHWMPTGVTWNPSHTDITNYYLNLGVKGGVGLVVAIILWIVYAMRALYRRIEEGADEWRRPDENGIVYWCLGIGLFSHAFAFISVSYFDQMFVFFYLLLGAMPGLVEQVETADSSTEDGVEAGVKPHHNRHPSRAFGDASDEIPVVRSYW